MKIYFGEVPDGSDYTDTFHTAHGIYDFVLELTDFEQFVIRDTCNRMVPIGYEMLDELIAALQFMKEETQPIAEAWVALQDELEYYDIAA